MMATPGMGIIFAGVASGICYLLINKLRKRKAEEERKSGKKPSCADDNRCACCLKPFVVECGIKCGDCGAKICTRTCNRYDRSDDTRNCLFCHQKRRWLKRNDRWFESFGCLPNETESQPDFYPSKSLTYIVGTEHEAINRGPDLPTGGKSERNSMETIRDMIEKIVEEIVGSVHDTPIDRLYDHFAYDELLGKYRLILTEALVRLTVALQLSFNNNSSSSSSVDTPSMATTALREFVERAVEEVRKLPALGNTAVHEKQQLSVTDRSYEDLLATAILNKVIEKYQKESVDGNSNLLPGFRNKRVDDSSEGLDEVDNGSSSLEPLSQDECNSECGIYPSKRIQDYPEPLSLMIEERIEEVTTYTSEDEVQHNEDNSLDFRNARRVPFPELGMDIVDPQQEPSGSDDENESTNQVVSQVECWQENWLFQKKKMQTSSEPVAMLVPNPSEDSRPLIGDKDAEDTSDLSECCAISDDEIEQEVQAAIEHVSSTSQRQFENGTKGLSSNVHKEVPDTDVVTDKDQSNSMDLSNGDLKIEEHDEKEEAKMPNSVSASTNPFKIGSKKEAELDESDLEKGKRNPFKNADLALKLNDSNEVQLFQDKVSPKAPMSTPINENLGWLSDYTFEILSQKDNVKNPFFEELKNMRFLDDEDAPKITIDFESDDEEEQVREFTEHYDIATQRHMDSLRRPRDSLSQEKEVENATYDIPQSSTDRTTNSTNEPVDKKCREATKLVEVESSHRFSQTEKVNPDGELSTPPRPGTIAEREHKKWENAPPIQNNPYSEENIQKRLLEKQYAKRPAELAGNNNELPKTSEPPAMFGRTKVDFKRFGRDYYINETKFLNDNSVVYSSPSSSMSQQSNTVESGPERKEQVKHEMPTLQEIDFDASHENSKTEANPVVIEQQLDKKSEEFSTLYHKFNSTGGYEKTYITTLLKEKLAESAEKSSRPKEEQRKNIRRLDLKAYGFDNEFNTNDSGASPTQQRTVNKLNLKSFGFDGGFKKAQSTHHLNKAEIQEGDQMSRLESTRVLGKFNKDSDVSKRISMFNKLRESNGHAKNASHGSYFSNMKSAESVPNISKIDHCNSPSKFSKYDKGDVSKFLLADKDKRDNWRSSCDALDSKVYSSSEDVSIEESSSNVNTHDKKAMSEEGDTRLISFPDDTINMPSVKRLAENFSKTNLDNTATSFKSSKTTVKTNQERAKTPEIQIVQSPKQMHSLTARSLSKEFREGLRQIPSKVTSYPVRQIKCEEQIIENEVFTKSEKKTSDVISRDKTIGEQIDKQS